MSLLLLIVSVPLRGNGLESLNYSFKSCSLIKFQSPCGEMGLKAVDVPLDSCYLFWVFQSPCGEMGLKDHHWKEQK